MATIVLMLCATTSAAAIVCNDTTRCVDRDAGIAHCTYDDDTLGYVNYGMAHVVAIVGFPGWGQLLVYVSGAPKAWFRHLLAAPLLIAL